MAHWLVKSEPFKWSWEMQVAAGATGTFWDGVRNHLAKQQLMAMRRAIRPFFTIPMRGWRLASWKLSARRIQTRQPQPGEPWVVVDLRLSSTEAPCLAQTDQGDPCFGEDEPCASLAMRAFRAAADGCGMAADLFHRANCLSSSPSLVSSQLPPPNCRWRFVFPLTGLCGRGRRKDRERKRDRTGSGFITLW